jgi:hypothetical protein
MAIRPKHALTTPFSLFESQAKKIKAAPIGGVVILSRDEIYKMAQVVRKRDPFKLSKALNGLLDGGTATLFGRVVKVSDAGKQG